MLLAGDELIKRVVSDKIILNNKDTLNKDTWKNFNGWQFDLSLGDEVFLTRRNEPIKLHDKQEFVSISSGEFALLITEEEIKMPQDLMAFINVRFSYKQKGLINISGFHVDPCYNGKLIFSVFNAGPNDIILRKSEAVFMIFFCKLTEGLSDFQGKINDESNEQHYIAMLEKDENAYSIIKGKNFSKKKSLTKIPGDMMSSLQGKSVSLVENNARIEKLENSFKIYGSIAIGVIVALLGFILSRV